MIIFELGTEHTRAAGPNSEIQPHAGPAGWGWKTGRRPYGRPEAQNRLISNGFLNRNWPDQPRAAQVAQIIDFLIEFLIGTGPIWPRPARDPESVDF